jgi:hypothetical protein
MVPRAVRNEFIVNEAQQMENENKRMKAMLISSIPLLLPSSPTLSKTEMDNITTKSLFWQ